MRWQRKKILITGATGFIGANLVRYFLKRQASVSILIRKTSDKWRIQDIIKKVSAYSVDLLDSRKLSRAILHIRPEIIFHTAAYGGYIFQQHTKKIFETNFLGTVNLVNACRNINFELFINTGSSSEYGIKSKAMAETDLLEPLTDYGVSKAAATLYCQAVAKREKRPIITLRLFSPYGYYEEPSRLIPSVIKACLKGENPKLSSPNFVRDFIFIEDIISAYDKAADNKDEVSGKIFNIGYGKQYTLGEAVNKIAEVSEEKIRPQWDRISNPRFEPASWCADISKAAKILNWKPKYTLEEGIKKNIAWFKENLSLYDE